MCGINGIALSSRSRRQLAVRVLERMRDVITHRGPDDEGVFVDGRVGLGHRRLSIVDVAGGRQPMANEDGRLQVVIDWRDPAVRQTLVLMVPITIGLGLINFNAVVDTFFAARLIDRFHAVSAINAAFRLYMLPQGMFSVAVATVLFPSLALVVMMSAVAETKDELTPARKFLQTLMFLAGAAQLSGCCASCCQFAEPVPEEEHHGHDDHGHDVHGHGGHH